MHRGLLSPHSFLLHSHKHVLFLLPLLRPPFPSHPPSSPQKPLWSTKTGGDHVGKASSLKPRTALPSLADHINFVPIAPAVSASAVSRSLTKDDSIAMSYRSFNATRQGLLRRTWMSLVDQSGLVVGSPQDDENLHGTRVEHEEEDEGRFSVEGDMNANASTQLRMNRASFVWLSLALGVRPYDSAWRKNYPCTLKNT